MKIISFFVLVVILLGLVLSITSLLKTTREIEVNHYTVFNDTKNSDKTISYNDRRIKVNTQTVSEFLFINNNSGSNSFITITLQIILFALVILLLFGPDPIRTKIYLSNSVLYVWGLIGCSVVTSWYFTNSFVGNISKNLGEYKYAFNYGSIIWLLFTLLISINVLSKFKTIQSDNLQIS
ncbi:MAG: hypothetical protein EOP47_14710 [Sphingobacteriaceae bacterium]|nr:MAG: hypothetical protein EOP47_14710 [Sphingobacteriaceae bacterium]